jgi:hypothetical protein
VDKKFIKAVIYFFTFPGPFVFYLERKENIEVTKESADKIMKLYDLVILISR